MKLNHSNTHLVRVKLACTKGMSIVNTSSIVGKCTYPSHRGIITKQIAKMHKCKQKKCIFLDKLEDCAYWDVDNTISEAKKKRVEKKNKDDEFENKMHLSIKFIKETVKSICIVNYFKICSDNYDFIVYYKSNYVINDNLYRFIYYKICEKYGLRVKLVFI